jgi:fructuronate reductase
MDTRCRAARDKAAIRHAPLTRIAEAARPAADTVAAVFELAGFARGDTRRETLEKLASAHLDTLRNDGVAAALAALS